MVTDLHSSLSQLNIMQFTVHSHNNVRHLMLFTTQGSIHAHLEHIIIDVLITLRECKRRKYLVNVFYSTLVTLWT